MVYSTIDLGIFAIFHGNISHKDGALFLGTLHFYTSKAIEFRSNFRKTMAAAVSAVVL